MKRDESTEILVLSPEHYAQLGGLALYLRQAVDALAKRGTVTFLGRSTSAPTAPDVSAPRRVTVLAAASRPTQIWRAVLWAADCRRYRRQAFIVCGHLYLTPLARLVQRLAGGHSLLVLLGLESWRPPPRAAARRSAARFDLYVSVSRTTTERFASWSGVAEERIHIVPPRIDPSPYRSVSRDDVVRLQADLGIEACPTLLTVARLDKVPERKGHHRVIKILPELRERHPGLVYLIAGDGPGRRNLERRVDSMGLTEAVYFLGSVSEAQKATLYRWADAFVLPSEGEGFGIALAEAAISDQPIVYSRLDASAEAVTYAERTWPVDPRSPAELLEAVDAALKSGRRSTLATRHIQTLPHGTIEAFEQAWQGLTSTAV